MFLCFLFVGDVTFAASPVTLASAVVAVMVAETPRESAVEATMVERAVAMPLLFKIVPWGSHDWQRLQHYLMTYSWIHSAYSLMFFSSLI